MYYRIKAVDNNLQVKYSQIVKVKAVDKEASIQVYPNPVTNKTIELYINDIPFGNYQMSLSESSGRKVLNSSLIINASILKKEIVIHNTASGNYQLKITNVNGFKKIIKVTVVN